MTGADGGYNLLNLRPGGPYTVEAADLTHTPQKVEVPNIALGETTNLNIAMQAAAPTSPRSPWWLRSRRAGSRC